MHTRRIDDAAVSLASPALSLSSFPIALLLLFTRQAHSHAPNYYYDIAFAASATPPRRRTPKPLLHHHFVSCLNR